jgi:outer membrane protein assembly factor BamB
MLACLSLSGEQLWTSGRQHRFGLGPYIISAREKWMWLLNDKGVLTLADLSGNRYRQLAQARVLQGHDSWAPLAIAGGRLLARDMTRMVCLDIRERAAAEARRDGTP